MIRKIVDQELREMSDWQYEPFKLGVHSALGLVEDVENALEEEGLEQTEENIVDMIYEVL